MTEEFNVKIVEVITEEYWLRTIPIIANDETAIEEHVKKLGVPPHIFRGDKTSFKEQS